MDDEFSWLILGALVVLGLPILAISAFVMALRLKGRVAALEAKVRSLQDDLARPQQARSPAAVGPLPDEATPVQKSAQEPTPAQDLTPADDLTPAQDLTPVQEPALQAEPDGVEPAQDGSDVADAAAARPAVGAPPAAVSLEERLGARWAVWVGGLALALGGVFLVRYSIEAGLLGPGARIVLGLLFSAGLIAGGEWLRRREAGAAGEGRRGVYIPGVVTAAGTTALFATIFAAYAFYGFIGPAAAFVILGVVGVLTMFAAALHGPWLAGLGLVGAYGTPFLVSSTAPQPWALAIFVITVTAAAFALARLRLWRWLALTATLAAFGWGFILINLADRQGDLLPAAAYVAVLAALVLACLVVDPHRGRAGDGRFDRTALTAIVLVGLLALALVVVADFSGLGLAVALGVAAAILAAALAFEAVAPAAGIAALLLLGVAALWPVAREIAAEPLTIVPERLLVPALLPQALSTYLTIVAGAGLALFGATLARLWRRAAGTAAAIALALSSTAGPLLLLACAYVRATGFAADVPFGAVALVATAVLAATADRFLRRSERVVSFSADSFAAAGSLHAGAATAALALALTMVLEGSPLTLAFALAALGAAWVSSLRPLAALRWSAAALTILVVLRLGGAWTLLGEPARSFPDWSDIALRYAIPALAIGLGGHLLRRHAVDRPAAILDSGAIVLGATAAALAIRLWSVGLEAALSARVGLAEAGLYVAVALATAIGFARGALITSSAIYRVAAPVSAVAATTLAVLGPVVYLNPMRRGEDVAGGLILNSLMLGFALPALLAGVLSWIWMRWADIERPGEATASALWSRPWPIGRARPIAYEASAVALLLAFIYVTLETRMVVSGPDMSFAQVPSSESYAYSAVWLVFGVLLLAAGLAAGSRALRLASALVMTLTVAKVFLVDMAALEGVWRALSFIGLGLVLVGIGLVYQRLLFGRGTDRAAQTS